MDLEESGRAKQLEYSKSDHESWRLLWHKRYAKLRSPSWVMRSVLPLALSVMILLVAIVVTWQWQSQDVKVLTVVGLVAVGALTAMSAAWARTHLDRMLADRKFLICTRCQYSLTGLPSPGTCPECGAQFDADQVRVFWTSYLDAMDYRSSGGAD
jgi:hypothetical protein